MQYYFIYSAGGGGGEWNGIKRIWKKDMPERLKKNILLKFGDIFFNHKTSKNIVRTERCENIDNVRLWLYDNVCDEYVINKSNILLDSGTSKLVNYIEHNYNVGNLDTNKLIYYFKKEIDENNIIQKYVDVIIKSKINLAVSFDLPDPFKVRSNNKASKSRRNIIEEEKTDELMKVSLEYTNQIFKELKNKMGTKNAINIFMPVIYGKWSKKQYDMFMNKLEFKPKNIAVGRSFRKKL